LIIDSLSQNAEVARARRQRLTLCLDRHGDLLSAITGYRKRQRVSSISQLFFIFFTSRSQSFVLFSTMLAKTIGLPSKSSFSITTHKSGIAHYKSGTAFSFSRRQ
jgi:CRP-like cAMP-binding protein